MYCGKRIKLRAFKEEDAVKLTELRSDFDGIKAFAGSPFPSNFNSDKEWISNMYPSGSRSTIYLAIEENSTGNFIGYCVARKIDYINSNTEVGILIHPDGRGKGYFKEISIIFYFYLFNEINLHKVYSYVLVDNAIAIQTDKKLGFVVEGEIKEQIYQGGEYKNVYFISLYAKDFLSKNNLFDYI